LDFFESESLRISSKRPTQNIELSPARSPYQVLIKKGHERPLEVYVGGGSRALGVFTGKGQE
jgi:hypothetical protein